MLKLLFSFIILISTSIISFAQPIIFGQTGVPHVLDLPVYVAYEKGFFAAQGLNVPEPVKFNNSPTTFAALLSGNANVITASMMLSIIDQYNGAPFVIAKAITYNASYLYSIPSIKTVAELKGKTVAVGGENDITRMHAEVILQAHGVYDNKWWWGPDTAKRYLALRSGQLEAANLIPPFTFVADKEGYVKLGKTNDYKLSYQKALVVEKNYAEKNKESIKKLIHAIDQAIVWLYDPKNKDEAITILSKISGTNLEDCSKAYELAMTDRYYILDDSISESAINFFIDRARTWGSIKNPKMPNEKLLMDTVKISP